MGGVKMLATSRSPNLSITSELDRVPAARPPSKSPRTHYGNLDHISRAHSQAPPNEQSRPAFRSPNPTFPKPVRRYSARSLDSSSPKLREQKRMVDVGTQYSPPDVVSAASNATALLSEKSQDLRVQDKSVDAQKEEDQEQYDTIKRQLRIPDKQSIPTAVPSETSGTPSQTKRHAPAPDDDQGSRMDSQENGSEPVSDGSPPKRPRHAKAQVLAMPLRYELCDTRDLVVLISSMLMELIRYNDAIPLRDGQLTRFHSRAPPGISVFDYLQRLTTHATLSPPILLSMVYYIDKLCALYPAFTISSLTVHRFLITSATVASKGLSDSFWTNKLYARVGGVSLKELALLELEFLTRVQWRIVPKPEVLVDYYRSLIERNPEYSLAAT